MYRIKYSKTHPAKKKKNYIQKKHKQKFMYNNIFKKISMQKIQKYNNKEQI